MNNYREQYLTSMAKHACDIMSKSELTEQDVQFLVLFKKELNHAERVPILTRILSGAEDVLNFVKKINTTNDEEATDENEL